ncbi:CHAT domain-containing protein [Streptomyces sp. SP17BM10]|uniref:CHAT domain-containing protein n=1 Tax=Streptomyces sp. SP17BM10 TaxID=3002530 RepID=UPI002E7A4519|nr:CHAT domain-containing protein [Streptomyces sp. SP17BM10]MEE1788773.1 CHAT domain-containing protein [Streptomyces sp. SP17BM10]
METVPFRLTITEAGDSWVVSCSSRSGEAHESVPAPYTTDQLRIVLLEVERSLMRSCSPVVTRRASLMERAVRDFGENLSGAVLAKKIGFQFDRCRSAALSDGAPMRVLIRTYGPNVSRIPWEYIVDPARDDYLALRVPIVRNPDLMDPVPPLEVTLPLRVLGVSAGPADLPVLDSHAERDRIAKALQGVHSKNVDVHWLPSGRWSDLARAVRSGEWHVLHCVCHGGFDSEQNEGFIELVGDDGRARQVYASDFERLVAESRTLRLIVLNACESAVCGADDVFSGTAANLLRAGVPAVVAMQYEITDQAAIVFASEFYERIAEGIPVDRAVTLTREDVKMRMGSLEWATPVLFLASDKARVFTVPGGGPEHSAPGGRDHQTASGGAPDGSVPGAATDEAEPGAPGPRPHRPRREEPRQPSLRRVRAVPPLGSCHQLALGPRDLLAVADADSGTRVFRLATGRLVAQCFPPEPDGVVQLAWSPWPRHVASRHESGSVVIWDVETEVPAKVISVGARTGEAVVFSNDGRWLAVAVKNRVQVYDAAGRVRADITVRRRQQRPGAWSVAAPDLIGPLAFAPWDRHVLVACGDGLVRQFDFGGHEVMGWPHPRAVVSLAVGADRLVTGCADGRVRMWSWDGHLIQHTAHGPRPVHLALSSDSALLAIAGDDASLTVWDVHRQRTAAAAQLADRPVGAGYLSGAGEFVTGTANGVVERWAFEP